MLHSEEAMSSNIPLEQYRSTYSASFGVLEKFLVAIQINELVQRRLC